ncbi:MAG: class I mannose-6-phosphate isomerase [Pseudomonadota bacterium]
MTFAARKLPTRMVEKVWGRQELPTPFAAPDGKRIGEIWFEPPPELDQLLVKYLFTSEKLSVQVHPSDGNALDGEDGKEECWLVLDAEPGAQLAIGFDGPISPEGIAAAARDGSIEKLLTWHDVAAGDVYYLPAGTVHAIGPGLSLVEVQQNSDTTFRLYDYGRPRELHLDRAVAVARGEGYDAENRSTVDTNGPNLVDRQHFRLDRVERVPDETLRAAYADALLALPLSGTVGYGNGKIARGGECVVAPSIKDLDFSSSEVALLTRPA